MNSATQFAKYIGVALLSAVSDWVVFTALFLTLGAPIMAQATSRIAGAIVSFAVNKYWSFQSMEHRRALIESGRFLVLFVVSYAISLTLFTILTWSGVDPYVAKLTSDTICFFFNFLAMRFWVYRSKHSPKTQPDSPKLHGPRQPIVGKPEL